MDATWIGALARARAEWPGVRIDDAALAARVASACERGARPEHAGDLVLAWGAGRGDAVALRELDRRLVAEVATAVRRLDRAPAFVDEVSQGLRVRLLVADAGRVRIDDYVARGPLGAWLAVAALRVALNLRRAALPASPDVLAELVSDEADPELRHLKTLHRAEFRDALEAALRALPDRSRAVLRLCYVDGLRMVQLARLYQVHETTAARWVSRAAADVAEDARRRLVARLAVSPSTLDSIARMVMSNLDLSIARLLRG